MESKIYFYRKKTLKAQSKNFREKVYILNFINDTLFDLHTSVSYAGVKYNIVS